MVANYELLKLAKKSPVEVCPACEGAGITEYGGDLCYVCGGEGNVSTTKEFEDDEFRIFHADEPDWVEEEDKEIVESDKPFIDYYSRYPSHEKIARLDEVCNNYLIAAKKSKKRVDLDIRPYPSPIFKNYDYTGSGPNETSPGGSPYFGIPGGGEKSMGDWIKKRRRKERRRKRKRLLSLLLLPTLSKTAQENILKEAAAWSGYNRALARDPSGVEIVLRVADELNLSRRELAWIIERESGWNASAWNRPKDGNPNKGASGLIQFMPSTLRYLGWKESPAEFRKLSLTEQAPWVKSFYRRGPRPVVPGDLYVATFMPKFVGHSDDTIVAAPGSKIWEVNAKGLREGGDGPITAGSIRAWAKPPISGGPGSSSAPVLKSDERMAEKNDDIYELINQLFSVAA